MDRFARLLAVAICFAALPTLAWERMATLPYSRAAWAIADNDLGEVDPTLQLTHLTILLNRTLERQAAFETLLREQTESSSPNFQRWLTPLQVGEQFGAPDEDIAALSVWLESQGLRVNRVTNSRVRIEFSGLAANVSSAFGAPLHSYLVDGEIMISPASAPQIPAFLSSTVKAVLGLETFRATPHHRIDAPKYEAVSSGAEPKFSSCSGSSCAHYVAPADFATIYDLNPVYQQGINGGGQTIAILGRARVYLPDIESFQQMMGLSIRDPIITVPPNGIDPGPAQSTPAASGLADQQEATLDVSRAGSVAPGATINLVVSANSPTVNGLQIAAEYVIDFGVANILSLSFGLCESSAGPSAIAFVDSLFSQAAAEGISIFVSSGDAGVAGCNKHPDPPPTIQSTSTNAFCASSYATCVGGTEFADTSTPSAYWGAINGSNFGSAFGYIPEGAWNEPINSSGNVQTAVSGGGVSAFIPTPSWQTGPGVPGAQGRYTPDVSFTASGHDGYFGCFAASGAPAGASGCKAVVFSGTSASTPSMAGIAALLNQRIGRAQGNLNPRLYALAGNPANGVFHDITVATSGVSSCTPSIPSMCNNSTTSPTGLTGGLAGYTVGPGYDMVTGLGSIDVAKLLSQWATPGQLQVPSSITFANQPVGTQSAAQVAAITNIGGSPVTISNFTGSDLTEFPGSTTCFTTLQPGGQCNLTISFAPSSIGLRSETVTVTSTGIGSPQSFVVSGIGSSTLGQLQVPSSISFANQQVGTQSAAQVVSITNIGGSPVTITNFTGSDLTEFPGTTTCFTTLQPGGQCNLTVSFAPSSTGLRSETVTVTSTGVGSPQSFTVSGTGITSTGTPSVPGPLSGLWWNANESGWGIHFTQRGNNVFAAWYTYDGTGNAKWYVSTCAGANGISGTCSGTLYQVTAGAFFGASFNPATVNAVNAGTLQVSFQNADSASMTYNVAGQTRTVAIVRQPLGTGVPSAAVNYTDLWWNPNESGWGLAVTQQYSTMFLAWYVYDAFGKPTWYVATCTLVATTCSASLLRTTGPAFGPTFNSAQVQVFTVGTITLTFSDANTGVINYTVSGVNGSKNITRQLF